MPAATPAVTPTEVSSNASVDRRGPISSPHQLLTMMVSALALLVSGAATPASADGGSGGPGASTSSGGGGGADQPINIGSNGGNGTNGIGGGGGGGGAGISGGNGGTGGNGDLGGVGGGGPGVGGASGAHGSSGGGGGGGGGGAHGFAGSTLPTTNSTGGTGGTGGDGSSSLGHHSGGGGGGGAGGYGAVVAGSNLSGVIGVNVAGGNGGNGGSYGDTLISPGNAFSGNGGSGGVGLWLNGIGVVTIGATSTISGGTGGAGGGDSLGAGIGLNGGTGGDGVSFSGNGGSLINLGTINGGTGGLGSFAAVPGGAGVGGNGVSVGNGLTFTNNGIISGGPGNIGGVGEGASTNGSDGGSGVVVGSGATATNNNTIYGGNGGTSGSILAGTGGNGGSGGIVSGGIFTNNGSITGGTGGPGGITGGTGGSGMSISGGTVVNRVAIKGGAGAHGVDFGGTGGSGVSISGGTLVNSGTIGGGNGGPLSSATGGPGGTGVSVTGGTIINSGTISGGLGSAGTGPQANAISFNGGTNRLELWSSSIINGNVVATTGSNDTLALGGAANGTFAVGQIGSQYQGFELFEKTGAGTWTLTGTTTANTPWAINQGTLSISADGSLGVGNLSFHGGTLENTAAFTTSRAITLAAPGGTFNTAADLSLTGVISGPGSLTKTGAGTLVLGGSNTYSGGTTIAAGVLSVASDASLGGPASGLLLSGGTFQNTAAFTTPRAVTLGAGGGVFLAGADLTLAGSVSGAGGLTKTGAATLTLTGNNVYTGSTTIVQGTLQIGNGGTAGSILGNVVNNGTLAFNRADNVTLGGTVSGSGMLVQLGTGILTLTADNTYSGNTIVAAGSLEVGNGGTTGSIVGDVLNSGSLAFNRADALVYGGAVSGNGVFTKAGAGTLTLTGNSTYTGNTIVGAGALNIAGSLGQTTVSVASGATLMGSGSIGGPVTVQNGGILSGGGGTTLSMGALTLNSGATTNALINGPGFVPFDVAGNVTAAGTLNIVSTGGFGPGVYHVIEYGGTFTNNGLALGSTPADFVTQLNTGTPQQLNITVYSDPTTLQFWQGGSVPVGGSGTWSAANPNWLNADSSQSTIWGGVQAVFHGTPGTVTVDGIQVFRGLEFVVGGYTLVAGNGGALAPTGTAQLWAEGSRTTATIAVPITGPGGIVKIGVGTIVLAAVNSYLGGTTIDGGTLSISADTNLGAASGGLTFNRGTLENTVTLTTARAITLANTGTFKTTGDLTATGVISGGGALTKAGNGRLTLTGNNTYSGGTIIHAGTVSVSADANLGAASGGLTFHGGALHNTGAFTTARAVTLHAGATFHTGADLTLAGVVSGGGALIKTGEQRLTLSGNNTYSGGTAINAGTLRIGDGGTSGSIQGNVANNGLLAFDRSDTLTYGGTVSGSGGLAKFGTGTLILTGNSTYTGGTTINAGTLQIGNGGAGGSILGDITNNGTLAVDSASNLVLAGVIAGSGALTKIGSGTLMLGGNNSYAGGTSVSQGTLAISSDGNLGAPSGGLTLSGGELLPTASVATARAITLGPGGGSFFTPGGVTLSASGIVSGPGALTLIGGGTLSLGGINTYTGPTTVNAGALVVNGSIASSSVLSVDLAGSVGGTGTLPSTAINAGLLAPGNSIGTITVQGNFTQNGGTYQVELSPSAADRVNVTGSATLNGGTVQLLAQPGSYANSTTYTIVNATGGVTGAYANIIEDFAFLTPIVSYDANNVFLTLALLQGAFSFAGNTPNEKAVGYALDRSFANASGDFATVIAALAGLSTAQGAQALNTISGQPWANFGTMNVATGAMFMNSVGQQMALARGGAAAGQRVALAEACDVASCEGPGPWSAWLSAVGGLGSVQGNRNASTFTYSAGGAAAGLDYRVDPRFLVGLSVGYTHGTQWTNGFMGQGWSDTVSVAAYGSFIQGGFYVDALAGYARSTNQLQRQIVFPNLQPRTANGSAGANQFLGQAEAGYRFSIYAPAQASLTPFARLAVQSVTQNAFSESGANSLSLNVAQQGTNSLRSTIGAELAGELPLGSESKLALALRLGWLHEFDDTSRPISAAFAGAPGNGFTVYGATPSRDSAVLGFQASTAIADATSIYLRYDGEVGGGTDNHAINLGLRVSW